ncbi:Peptidoglycan/LPS O-acetylase OafA/YrhL, contains acyltransferase and SGNH-hydrolase domains [Roseivivax lentus]|uniref:Peptidoglycan/LPS O-acetylase OafA/YrhL, contains acyltransferase and SGNH-hydrolase domains n=1 Tax=Roseivivax lentus TaxID=633194 RepID=A0A1N7Q5B5_9RHOB|nr:acyltransferase family protein [Roseivivax lentus]SIT18062.1 Peptidoglycan/LPS O-acetylase OafA/YrhL, contains acyltransferase and SGNH-hydrolase domains [Roseivivax lentus]
MSGLATPHLPYRADIDGLRAIAVGSVVLYHFGVALPGGFTGVDVFFVISGYLIGGLLWAERAQTGRVRLGAFWLRRFRRLAPAFFAMALVTSLVAWALLLPFELREYGKALIAASLYLANVLFYRQAGYFDAASEDKPLLHTWSLSVEEQFYLCLPLLVLALARHPRGLVWTLAAIWAASLAACLWVTPQNAQATFYLFPFRAWELLSGVLLAIWMRGRPGPGPAWAGWGGLLLIGVGFVTISAQKAFPGAWALIPVLGTMGVLWAGAGPGVGAVLRHPLAVFVGRISYSLYLWHWPVLTLSLQLRGAYAGWGEAALWMGLSVLLAWASWAAIEQPVRRGRLGSPRALLGFVITASAAALAFGTAAYLKDGLPGRFGPEARLHIAASGDFLQDFSRCTTPGDGPFAGLEICSLGPDGPPRVLVWGDSHLRAMHEGLRLAATDMPTLAIWRAGCPPLFGIAKSENSATPAEDAACAAANSRIAAAIAATPSLARVLLIGRWAYYTEGTGIGLDAGNRIAVAHPGSGTTGPDALARAVAETVPALRGGIGPVFVLAQPPEQPAYDSRLAAREAAHAGWPGAAPPVTRTSVPRDALGPRMAAARALWSGAEVTLLDPWPALCDAHTCFATRDGVGQYFDTNHLTNSAARRLAPLLAPVFEGLD